MASALKVFETYELVEAILLYLPLRQLLLSQKVSKAFYDVVNRSSCIKRALFMEPSPTNSVAYYCQNSYPQSGSAQAGWKTSPDSDCNVPMLNPFILQYLLELEAQTAWNYTHPAPWEAIMPNLVSFDGFFEGHFPLYDASASIGRLHKMSLTYPPLRAAEIEIWSSRLLAQDTRCVENGTGLQYGQLRSAAKAFACEVHNETGPFRLTGCEEWRVLARSVDKITGQQMLKLLDLSNTELNSRVLRSWRKVRKRCWFG